MFLRHVVQRGSEEDKGSSQAKVLWLHTLDVTVMEGS